MHARTHGKRTERQSVCLPARKFFVNKNNIITSDDTTIETAATKFIIQKFQSYRANKITAKPLFSHPEKGPHNACFSFFYNLLTFFIIFLLDLYGIKAFSINTHSRRNRQEGLRIYCLDISEQKIKV